MNTALAAMMAAAWLGLLTSISPCPLATNIAAVSYLSRRMHSRRMAVAGAVAYALGRVLIYLLIGLLVVYGLAAAPALSSFLRNEIGPFLGPLLICVGLVLIGWLRLPLNFGVANESVARRLAGFGLAGEFMLGMLFALTFCPVSAALFFGTLTPLAITSGLPVPVFLVFGLGTALPVGIIAVFIALGLKAAGQIVGCIQRWQGAVRCVTASVIIAVGVWLTLTSSLGLFSPQP